MTTDLSGGAGIPAPTSVPQAPASTEAQAAADYRKMMHKVKLDGRELDVPYDELVNSYQLKSSSTKRFQEAAAAKQQISELLSKAKEDPWMLLEQLGINPDEIANKRVAEKIEWDLLPKEKKELITRQRELEKREREVNKYKEEQTSKEQQALYTQAAQEIDTEIGDVLKASGLQPSPRVVARVAEIMIAHLEKGDRIHASKALERVDKDVFDEAIHYFDSLPIEKLVERLPKEFIKKLRKYDVSNVQTGKPFGGLASGTDALPKPGGKKSKSTDEFFERLEKKLTR